MGRTSFQPLIPENQTMTPGIADMVMVARMVASPLAERVEVFSNPPIPAPN
jgi:hypothetical protein